MCKFVAGVDVRCLLGQVFVVLLLGWQSAGAQQLPSVPVDLHAIPADAPLVVPADILQKLATRHAGEAEKISSALQQALSDYHALAPEKKASDLPGLFTRDAHLASKNDTDPHVLVEVRHESGEALQAVLDRVGGFLRTTFSEARAEVSVPVTQIGALAGVQHIHFVKAARRVTFPSAPSTQPLVPLTGGTTTAGVALSGADLAHGAGIDGTGTTIAVIDRFNAASVVAAQGSGDWPSGGQLTTVDMDGGGFGSTGSTHGISTLDIAFDLAPGADFIAYETQTIGQWYNAIIAAVGAGADIISASLGAPLDGIGDGTAQSGSIAEASQTAFNNGVLVVNAAGNSREIHWGGLFDGVGAALGPYSDSHDWGGGGNINPMLFCLPNGFGIRGELFWSDWVTVDHDYALLLFEFDGATWQFRSLADDLQDGVALGRMPQEFLAHTVVGALGAGGCPANSGAFGWVIAEGSTASDQNLQFFANQALVNIIPERSLGFPADSPHLLAVGAIDAGVCCGAIVQESYSSEGPILELGGGLAPAAAVKVNATHDKLDVMSFANVSTVAGGFNGTSSATPHVAGFAALIKQANPGFSVAQLMDAVRTTASSDPDNDGGSVGYDNAYGFGLVRTEIALPVELTSFEALADGETVTLRWETVSETNNAGFEVQVRAEDGEEWERVGWKDGIGTTTVPQQYQLAVDELEPQTYTFRLKQVDFDGTFAYSPEVEVAVEMIEAYRLTAAYPNPFNPTTQFTVAVQRAQDVRVAVFDMTGRRVRTLFAGPLHAQQSRSVVFEASDLPSGVYYLRAFGETFQASQAVVLMK